MKKSYSKGDNMIENIFIGLIFAWAIYFIYKSIFKSSGCSCGTSSCKKG
jgi:hypothetical protein